jgi:hypothetical protein
MDGERDLQLLRAKKVGHVCLDGEPQFGLVSDKSGRLYGAAGGTVFPADAAEERHGRLDL